MNGRIKELQFQAAAQVNPLLEGSEWQQVFVEKFTELIVQECLQACENIRQDALVQKESEFLTDSGKTLYEGVYGGATNCGFAIQSMFKSE